MRFERAVINSGPLVGLSLAGRLDVLPALFAEFWIPQTVFHVELRRAGYYLSDAVIEAACAACRDHGMC